MGGGACTAFVAPFFLFDSLVFPFLVVASTEKWYAWFEARTSAMLSSPIVL